MWYGPAHAQINNMFPSEYQGFSVAVFNFSGAIAGTIATTTLGIITAKLNANENYITDKTERQIAQATVDGRVLACGVAISYLTAAPLFIKSGIEYSKGLDKIKAQAVVRGTLKRASSLNRSEEAPRTLS